MEDQAALHQRMQTAEADAGDARRELAEAQEALAAARRGLKAARTELADITSSTSWRITKPVRAVLNALKGRR
jgi:hypothetical protein